MSGSPIQSTEHACAARRPRVLYLFNHAGMGGTERYAETLVSGLAPARMEAFLAWHEDGPLRERMQALGVSCVRIRMRSRFDLAAAWRLAAFCRMQRIDIVHTQFLRERYLVLLSRFFGNRAAHVGSVHLMLDRPAGPPLRWIDRAAFHDADVTIAVCEALRRQLAEAYGLSGDKLVTIFNGVTPAPGMEPDALAEERRGVRTEFGIAGNETVFLSVGRLSAEKGWMYLIDGIRSFLASNPESRCRFLLVGDGPQRNELEQAIALYGLEGVVRLAGYRQDVARILHGADVYVSPSRTEALSLSILEAMDAGLPVIATAVGGTPEMVGDTLGDGILVPYGDVPALSRAMAALAADGAARARMGQGAREAVAASFSLARMVGATEALYRKLSGLDRRPGSVGGPDA